MRLEGRIVELQVLSDDDYKDLAETCLDPEIWRDTIAKITSEAELRDYLDRGLRQYAAGEAMPFVIRLRKDSCAVGSTRLAITSEPGALEIGWTFIAPAWHRRGINAEAKLLLLEHAFENIGCRQVVFKVAAGNLRSRSALTSLGAIERPPEQVLSTTAGDVLMQWFELSVESWPAIRMRLSERVARGAQLI